MSQVEIYQSTDKQTQVHITFEDGSIDGTSGRLHHNGGFIEINREGVFQCAAQLLL